MHIRTFRAANLNTAMVMIRDQMGPDAVVLHTREIGGGRWGLWGRRQLEVTAGLRSGPAPSLDVPAGGETIAAAAEEPDDRADEQQWTRARRHPAC